MCGRRQEGQDQSVVCLWPSVWRVYNGLSENEISSLLKKVSKQSDWHLFKVTVISLKQMLGNAMQFYHIVLTNSLPHSLQWCPSRFFSELCILSLLLTHFWQMASAHTSHEKLKLSDGNIISLLPSNQQTAHICTHHLFPFSCCINQVSLLSKSISSPGALVMTPSALLRNSVSLFFLSFALILLMATLNMFNFHRQTFLQVQILLLVPQQSSLHRL